MTSEDDVVDSIHLHTSNLAAHEQPSKAMKPELDEINANPKVAARYRVFRRAVKKGKTFVMQKLIKKLKNARAYLDRVEHDKRGLGDANAERFEMWKRSNERLCQQQQSAELQINACKSIDLDRVAVAVLRTYQGHPRKPFAENDRIDSLQMRIIEGAAVTEALSESRASNPRHNKRNRLQLLAKGKEADSGDDEIFSKTEQELDEEILDLSRHTNRAGQRSRRRMAEQKYGPSAKHLRLGEFNSILEQSRPCAAEESDGEAMHPSWMAAQHQRKQVVEFSGKKIKF